MTTKEALDVLEQLQYDLRGQEYDAVALAIQSLNQQLKLQDWIAGYMDGEYVLPRTDEEMAVILSEFFIK